MTAKHFVLGLLGVCVLIMIALVIALVHGDNHAEMERHCRRRCSPGYVLGCGRDGSHALPADTDIWCRSVPLELPMDITHPKGEGKP